MAQRIQFRQDTSIRWTAINPVLAMGEPAYETDTGKQKIGDGKTSYKDLPYRMETGVAGPAGPAGPQGNAGPVGSQGNKGDTGPVGAAGPANILSVGLVSGGSSAAASITGSSPSQVLNLVLPQGLKGDAGPPCSLSVGSVVKGTTPSATITGTAPSQVLNLILPQGDQGPQGNQGIQGIVGPVGPIGPKGDAGAGAVIQGVAATWPPSATPADGDLWIVGSPVPVGAPAGSVTGDGVVYDTTTKKWLNVGQMRGPQGVKGDTGAVGPQGPLGPANTLSIGSVTSSTLPSATITGTAPNQTLNLVLSKGDQGIQGIQGAIGPAGPVGPAGPANSLTVGTVAAGLSPTVTITGNAPSQTISFTLPKGDKGDPGSYVTTVIEQKGSVTLNSTHVGALLWFTLAGNWSVTVTKAFSDSVPIGTQITFLHDMSSAIVSASISVFSSDSFIGIAADISSGWFIRNRLGSARLYKLSNTRWALTGDITAQSPNTIQIMSQPLDTTAYDGDVVTFTSTAQSEQAPITFKWQQSADGGTTWTDIAGTVGGYLTVTATVAISGRKYRMVVSNPVAGTAFSLAATLTVAARPVADGTTWPFTQNGQVTGNSINGVAFSSGVFVGGSGQWSADGRNWTAAAGNIPAIASRPVFGNGTWLAAGAGSSANWATSSDGKNWVQRIRPFGNTGNVVFGYGFGRFVAFWSASPNYWVVSSGGTAVTAAVNCIQAAYSTDAINWTLCPPITGMITGLSPANSSTNPFAQSAIDAAFISVNAVGTGGGLSPLMVAAGITRIGPTNQYLASADGINWVLKTFPSARIIKDIAFSGTTFVAVGTGNAAFYTPTPTVALTTATIAFTQTTMPTSANWSGVAFGNGRFVAVADSSATAATSVNGITWAQQTLPVSSTWSGVAFGNSRFVAVYGGGSAVSGG